MKKKVLLGFVAGGLLVVLCVLPVFAITYEPATAPWKLTNTDEWEFKPAWTADCSKVAYYREVSAGVSNVYVINNANTASPDSPVKVSIGSTEDKCTPRGGLTFNQAGDKVLFSTDADGDVDNYSEIYIANADGSGTPTELRGLPYAYESPSINWTSTTQWVVYEKNLDLEAAILSDTSLSDPPTAITNFGLPPGNLDICALAYWSPDGTKIVFMRGHATDTTFGDIYVLENVDDIISGDAEPRDSWIPGIDKGTNLIRITNNSKMSAAPCFSLDGNKIFYVEDSSGTFDADNINTGLSAAFGDPVDFDIHIVDTDGSNDTKYDNKDYNQGYLNMSPDGMWVTYMDDSSGNGEIYVSAVKIETGSLGSTAGTAGSLDGSEIDVPEGALGTDTDFSIHKPKLSAAQEAGTPFCVRSFGPADTTFNTSVNITIHYTDKELGGYSEGSLYIVKWNDSTWERETGTITRDKDNNKITIPVDSFSDYGVEGSTAADDDDDKWYECAIATASYGTSMAEEIKALSAFRDQYLLTNKPGQILVSTYERISPPVADFIRDKETLKAIIRAGLKPLVKVADQLTK